MFWSDPKIEPKRSHRFVVPLPIYVPPKKLTEAGSPATQEKSIKDLIKNSSANLLAGEYGKNNIFDFFAISCTKPNISTEVNKVTPGGATSHPIVREDQATVYEFSPVKIEILDTYSHDIASTLTAYLYAYGNINAVQVDKKAGITYPGKLIKFSNGTHDEFHIYEALAGMPPNHGPPPRDGSFPAGNFGRKRLRGKSAKARKWILYNPHISKIDFGTYSYGADDLSKVTIEIVYDNFDYEFALHDFYPGPPASQTQLTNRQIRQRERASRRASRGREFRGETGRLQEQAFRERSRTRQREEAPFPRPAPPPNLRNISDPEVR